MESMREGDLVADRYRLGARIGRGAMGQVFAARDERLQRDVAVKLVDLGATADRTVAERFHREAIATASLNHPNIVTIFDADTEGQTAYIVMELLEGRPLSQLVREQGPLPLADAVRIAGQVARALVATHRIGVVHRDIKPANIMIDGRSVKLLDFGIALVSLDAEANLTAPATTLGTAAYMSPEQARGERATAASDVYALGGVLMVMLTGHAPFPGDNAVAVLHQQIADRAPLVSSRRSDAPPTLDDLVARMLAKDPAHRPTSDEVVTALAHLWRNLPAGGTRADRTVATPVLPPQATAPQPAATAIQPQPTAVQPPVGRVGAAGAASPGSTRRIGTGPSPGAARPVETGRYKRAASWLALVIVALLVFAVAWAVGSSLLGGALAGSTPSPTGQPTSAPPTTQPTTEPPATTPATQGTAGTPGITLPTITLPTELPSVSFPSVQDVGLEAALSGVDLAIEAIDGGRSEEAQGVKDALMDQWDDARQQVRDGERTTQALQKMRKEVDKAAEHGSITIIEAEAIRLALRAVEAAG